MNHISASFSNDSATVIVGPKGQIAHRDHIGHTTQFAKASGPSWATDSLTKTLSKVQGA